VVGLLTWIWGSAQALASLFSQLQGSGAVPPRLAPVFGAFAALQFQGVALPPECTGAPPFQGLWAGLYAALGASALAALALWAGRAPPGGAAPLCALPRLALALACRVLFIGYGALLTLAANAVTCLPEAPMLVADYAASRGDGTSLQRALGIAAAPPWATLQAAAGDALLARASGLAALLRTTIPVSVLASDAFQPCQEGPHADAFIAGWALVVLLVLVPLLGLLALWRAGRLPLCCSRGAAAGAGAPAPAPAAAALCAAFADDALQEGMQWWLFWEKGLTATCAGAVALSTRGSNNPVLFLGMQGLILWSTLASAGVIWVVTPHVRAQAWRTNITAALYGTAFTAAAVTILLRFSTVSLPGQWALGVAPVVLAVGLFVTLLRQWYFSLLQQRRSLPPVRTPPRLRDSSGSANGSGGSGVGASVGSGAAAAAAAAARAAAAAAGGNGSGGVGAGAGGGTAAPAVAAARAAAAAAAAAAGTAREAASKQAFRPLASATTLEWGRALTFRFTRNPLAQREAKEREALFLPER